MPLCVVVGVLLAGLVRAQAPAVQSPQDFAERLRRLEAQLEARDAELQALRRDLEQLGAKSAVAQPAEPVKPASLPAAQAPPRWYDRLSIRGYGQFRYTSLFGEDNTPSLNVPNDRSVNEPETLFLRRGRVILSGDVTEHVFLYAQMDFAGSTGAPDLALQMRDFYADISVDDAKEFRFRVGTSKIPFGWVNMQSSQNRAPIERPDAINSAAEGERDLGAFFYWAPAATRALFRELIRSGRKGSGDYGVFGLGVFTGQGPNRSDQNGEVHTVLRLCNPFELPNGQVIELGVQGYTGRFVPSTAAIAGTTPGFSARGVRDERIGVTMVVYPQPLGFEMEWNWGVGPTLSDDRTRITDESLQGGYLMVNYLLKSSSGTWFPFVRWQYFDGARKFARNAPRTEVNELDLGFEWNPWPEVEITAMYTHTFWRTDTSAFPYGEARGDDRVGLQVQFNF